MKGNVAENIFAPLYFLLEWIPNAKQLLLNIKQHES